MSLSTFIKSIIWITALVFLIGCNGNIEGMLNPKGIVAFEERRLFFDTFALMLIVILPVIVMSITFVYHYRVSHRLRDYEPNWAHSYLLESLWWGIPCVIIIILAVLTWKKTHQLDPYHKITAQSEKALLIQAIALPWKWLFIYPEQNIATVNDLVIPVGQEIEYWFTTDNVSMSAFIVPQLGSQIYAMAGMRTRLYLLADQPGDYIGMNTLYNGGGFSDMHFMTHAVSKEQFQQWLSQVKASQSPLTDQIYTELLAPSIADKPRLFSQVPTNLFQNVIDTYVHSSGTIHPRENISKIDHLAIN